ncbi:sensor histidine kinase [Clavibacter michiganensis]|uniref:sensor histidine kinase n=5 Tax=Clavibacter michiganensis TaxID=28447 RepID=UPI001D0B0473|nr:HAMP domain-containing sensor histidine kinase [Clavibacter michiganensis]MDO4044184.1 HAMP domain-containing sensor histidine kinase [Clavibacter michiganensis]MDO4053493.1 HAMP domain-containing sensor histidine kinase [Clavibacter michiganensis]MDO4055576.1 HAMP domain-containing sensor histidine kinase [Clavibacter michiganensis]MDO4067868.1 HAMP domain-containing sensor histidine kinase [Clavibacter michiganensis]UDM13286.1 HAMP domain-containing histidine kinase [Clavibacter michigane
MRPVHDYVSEKWNNVSLRTKITSVTVLLLLLGLLVSGAGTMYLLRQQMVSQLDAQLRVTITQLPKVLNTDASMPDTFTQDDVATADPAWFVVLLDAQGDVLADNWTGDSAEHPRVFGLDLARASQINNEIVVFSDNSGKKAWHGIVRVSQNASPDAMEYSTLVVARPLEQVDDLVATYIVIFASFGLAVVVLGAAVTRMLVTSTFGPLREVERTAAAIAGGDFSQRLGGATPNTEVGRLNRSLNMMLSRIDRAFADRAKTIDQMRRFVGDASHELRTPLVSVRGYAELYRMGALQTPEDVSQAMERIEKEAIRMGGLVEDLLELARLDETKPLQLAPVDLYPIARDAALDAMASSQTRTVTALPPVLVNPVGPVLDADGLEPTQDLSPDAQRGTATTSGNDATGPIAFAGATLSRFRARRSRRPGETATDALSRTRPGDDDVRVPAEGFAMVSAEENKIRQVVTNLIGNAVRFAPAGSPIELATVVDEAAREARIEVRDHGDGVPPQIREKIFQRFWRADTSRTRETGGSGLGLAIVSAIVAAHRGRVDVVETEGGGATFRVILPLLPSAENPATPTASAPASPAS